MKAETKKARDVLAGKVKPKKAEEIGLSTGSIVLNLGFTGKTKVGLWTGHYYLFVGDSAAGKTALALQTMAEAANNPAFDNYRFYLMDIEHSITGDKSLPQKYGQKLMDRLEFIHPIYVEEVYDIVNDLVQSGVPFIAACDSNDALLSRADEKKRAQQAKARASGEEVKGSFGTAKAKANKAGVSSILHGLHRTQSIFINISQTIANVGNPFQEKGRSGGGALKFFNSGEAWFSIAKSLKKKINKRERKIGSLLRIVIKKNRSTGREPIVEIPFYPNSVHGFDDIGACVWFLLQERRIQREGKDDKDVSFGEGKIHSDDFAYTGTFEGLVQKIEKENLEKDLRLIVAEVWDELEEASKVHRKRRYL